MKIYRNRIIYGVFILLVIILGLGSRRFSEVLPIFLGKYSGDTLWALMIFLGMGFLFHNKSIGFVTSISLAFCYFIEFSQLYHSTWIDQIRNTSMGGLILGFGFLWSDLTCYTVGVGIGAICEYFLYKKRILPFSR